MNRKSDKKFRMKGLVFLASWLIGPMLIWASLAALLVAPFPVYTGETTLLHWANIALAGSLIYYILKGPRMGSAVIVYWLVAVWLITVYGWSWPRWQFWLALWALAWGGQAMRLTVQGEKWGLLKDVPFLLAGPLWAARFIYKRIGAVY